MENTPTDDTHATLDLDLEPARAAIVARLGVADFQEPDSLLKGVVGLLAESMAREADAEARHASGLVKARRSHDRNLAFASLLAGSFFAAGVVVGVML
jgi:hypothetical protein